MRPEGLIYLRCPLCGDGFALQEKALRCPAGHSFDLAREGHVDLIPGGVRRPQADTAAMVRARETFLGAGHFAGLRGAVAEAAARALGAAGAASAESAARTPGCLIEVGAGTAYYLAGVLERCPNHWGIALDLSKHAVRRAAKAHPRLVAAVVCDVWHGLPLHDGCADLILDVFAPRNAAEFRRVLRPHGRLLVVSPTRSHLHELVEALDLLTVDRLKEERLQATLGECFANVASALYEERLALTAGEAATLASMGPSAHHLQSQEIRDRLDRYLDTLATSDRAVSGETAIAQIATAQTTLGGAPDAPEAPRLIVTVSVRLTEYQVRADRARA